MYNTFDPIHNFSIFRHKFHTNVQLVSVKPHNGVFSLYFQPTSTVKGITSEIKVYALKMSSVFVSSYLRSSPIGCQGDLS